jgi:ribonuclease P protein component
MFTILYTDNGEQAARLGLAISKKHCKLSVGRNRLKRLIRESFRHHQTELQGLDIVVLNQPAAMRAGNKVLSTSLQRHWQRCQSLTADAPKQSPNKANRKTPDAQKVNK